MGYTRYFENVKPSKEIATIASKIIELSPVAICGRDGYGEPIINSEEIKLNGSAELGQDCESFVISGKPSWDFCKTNREPYDEVVAAILMAADQLDPDAKISSDGSNEDDGASLYRKALTALPG